MHEDNQPSRPPSDGVAWQALQYVSGQLDARQTAEFERILGEDQHARDTLCRAVQFAGAIHQRSPIRPDPAYQERVRRRLGQTSNLWSWLARPREYRGHPMAWSALGACLAFISIALVLPLHSPGRSEPTAPATVVTMPADDSVDHATAGPPTDADVARVWSNLHSAEHLERTRDEEARRRNRLEEWRTRPLTLSAE